MKKPEAASAMRYVAKERLEELVTRNGEKNPQKADFAGFGLKTLLPLGS
jgi:hypothetical protein